MAELILEIVEGDQAGRQTALTGTLDVGRDPSAGLTVDDDQVSRRHARIDPSGDGAVVQDLGSTNGTYVNDQPVHARQLLHPGDRIRFGLTVLELVAPQGATVQRSAVAPTPQVTAIGHGVLQPVPDEQLGGGPPQPADVPPRPAEATPQRVGAPALLVDEAEPAFVPRTAAGDPEAESDYAALAKLVDTRVKRRTNIAVFAVLSIAGLAVLIFFGVS